MSVLRTILFMGALMGSAVATCDEDEMDLCDDAAPAGSCGADEMDLCDSKPPAGGSCGGDEMDLCGDDGAPDTTTKAADTTTKAADTTKAATTTTTKATTTTNICLADEMDLCDGAVEPVVPTTQAVVTGNIALKLNGATKEHVTIAVKDTLAAKFNVPSSAVSVTVTKGGSRRLSVLQPFMFARRLEDAWTVAFTIVAEASKLSAMDAQLKAIEADSSTQFMPQMKQQLLAAGASQAVVDSLKVESFKGEAKQQSVSTTAKPGVKDTEADPASTFKLSLALGFAFVAVASRS